MIPGRLIFDGRPIPQEEIVGHGELEASTLGNRSMTTIRLIHWKPEEAADQVRMLESAGFAVLSETPRGPSFLRNMEAEKPHVIVIDLSRLPSQGRDLAVAIRKRKGTRNIPLIFIGGAPAKVEKIKGLLPDAFFGSWEEASSLIKRAIEEGAGDVLIPNSVFAAYAGKPLASKLGVKEGSVVAIAGSPGSFVSQLEKAVSEASLVTGTDENADLTLWFVRTLKELQESLDDVVKVSKNAPVWIAWPKRGSALESDLKQQVVRDIAMSAGMVDYKICSLDRDWSALLFTWRELVD